MDAYSILDVFEISKPRGKKRKKSRLLRIRNLLGRKEWIGKWSDDSAEIKKNKELIENELNKKCFFSKTIKNRRIYSCW